MSIWNYFSFRRLRKMKLPEGRDWGQIEKRSLYGLSTLDGSWIEKPDLMEIVGWDQTDPHTKCDGGTIQPGDSFTHGKNRWQIVNVWHWRDPTNMFKATCRLKSSGSESDI